ncbi:segregation/condensation protein A [Anabaena sp. FACHB-1237]|uniref:segregation/condensation protein A n=1 Tax=Anabaena sp. FACHB-1237 TaxID=2692769 RepID=UPI0016818E7D|nr:ScpA family protein [Anabaena sp. FACHB-1237]MBD2136659.1 segregation/condensation protein A [Anabaena sp. FACHB-1237]
MNTTELLTKINHLIKQAEQGEINPWDVQVIEVIDDYLALMNPESNLKTYQTDLYQSGQAFLSASILVLFKANTLTQISRPEDIQDEVIDDTVLTVDNGLLYSSQRLHLEQHLRRRPAAMPPGKRRVTLQELIEQLHLMANQLKQVEKVVKTKTTKRYPPAVKTMQEALDLAHQENLTEVAAQVEELLHLSAKTKEENSQDIWWTLPELVNLWTKSKYYVKNQLEHSSANGELVSIFWALLLLCAQSKVELFQEEFYQEVTIRLPVNC